MKAPQSLLVRPMDRGDIPAVESASGDLSGEWDALLSECGCYVAEAGGELLGYLAVEPDKGRWYVVTLDVLPSQRRLETLEGLTSVLASLTTPDRPHVDLRLPREHEMVEGMLRALGFKAWRLTCDRECWVMRWSLYAPRKVRPRG